MYKVYYIRYRTRNLYLNHRKIIKYRGFNNSSFYTVFPRFYSLASTNNLITNVIVDQPASTRL